MKLDLASPPPSFIPWALISHFPGSPPLSPAHLWLMENCLSHSLLLFSSLIFFYFFLALSICTEILLHWYHLYQCILWKPVTRQYGLSTDLVACTRAYTHTHTCSQSHAHTQSSTKQKCNFSVLNLFSFLCKTFSIACNFPPAMCTYPVQLYNSLGCVINLILTFIKIT